jgi:hypothetical protein
VVPLQFGSVSVRPESIERSKARAVLALPLIAALILLPTVAARPALALEPGKSLDPTLIHDADEVVAFLIEEQTAAREAEIENDVDRDPYSRASLQQSETDGYILSPFVRRERRGVTEIATTFTSPARRNSIELKIVFPAAGKDAEAALGTLPEIREIELKTRADSSEKKTDDGGGELLYSSSKGGSELIVGLGRKSFLVLSSKAPVERAVLSALAQKIPVEQLRESGKAPK